MKKALSTIVLLGAMLLVFAQQNKLSGVYSTTKGDEKIVWLFVDGYCSQTHYKQQQYISTFGGPFTFNGKSLNVKVEYNDADAESVGQTLTIPIHADATGMNGKDGTSWIKEPSKKQDLDGLWRITGRKQGDKMTEIQRGDRKTIKLLVDGYFQWIAINPAEKGFYGTGGGQYTFNGGQYTEHILFFSRDNARVSAQLSFEGALKDGVWHHSGLSSKGDPIHEIWSRDK